MIDNYNYFLEIEKQRNITKASAVLFVTQPSLSKYLNKLEKELGVTLFDRSVSPLKLTRAGALYLDYVNKHIQLDSYFKSELEKFKDPYQKINIGIATWRGATVIPHIYGYFINKYPSYSIEFKEGPGSYTQQLLENNKVDFCLMNVANDTININLSYVTLDNEELRIAISKNHPYVKQLLENDSNETEIDLKKLENETFIMLQDNQNLAKKSYELLDYLNVKPKKIIKTNNLNTALNIAATTQGVTFYPYSKIIKHNINNDTASFIIKGNEAIIPFALIYNKDIEFSDACKKLINFIFSIYKVDMLF
ncbi:MAG: LysR family transcriptional regulator [Sedimentibacter sp.]|uniref:LysR family transcriptional regulator n=1 Tax=Sedimentibacter sp. TaxID=1960295 RepID=UPI003159337C